MFAQTLQTIKTKYDSEIACLKQRIKHGDLHMEAFSDTFGPKRIGKKEKYRLFIHI